MVDIASMMQKLEKSEKAREEIEQRLMVQDAKMGMMWTVSCLLILSMPIILPSNELQATLCVSSPFG